jgi:hypothetical protein
LDLCEFPGSVGRGGGYLTLRAETDSRGLPPKGGSVSGIDIIVEEDAS